MASGVRRPERRAIRCVGDKVAVALHVDVGYGLTVGTRSPEGLPSLDAVEHEVSIALHFQPDPLVLGQELIAHVEPLHGLEAVRHECSQQLSP
jgi:hypothetical protein